MKTKTKPTKMETYLFIALSGISLLLQLLFVIGVTGMISNRTPLGECEKTLDVVYGHLKDSSLTIDGVMNKRVRYKNGNICKIVGGASDSLLNEWENGNVSGFGRLEDIQEIIE